MSLSLVGLRVPGVVIENPQCAEKTYPRFFDDLTVLVGGRAGAIKSERPAEKSAGRS